MGMRSRVIGTGTAKGIIHVEGMGREQRQGVVGTGCGGDKYCETAGDKLIHRHSSLLSNNSQLHL